ncbi:type II toxin-antitoxin system PemK/MazF family toxin [Oryzibacter oryziterrae]|uniref:type II toxin-antitoxin system PemK/MazF family toxin n=1 Tax=Oryzibacter oryziterrae TaxID=2766474 RepID=UPI001F19DB23|nr:type II toxin-antitoxin system PemK/MazF family toxin [Oryzibacter oryziterrae]
MKRGDIVTVSAPGDYGKPRPAVVIQSDRLAGGDSVLVALLTSTLTDTPFYRLQVDPEDSNGLRLPSQVMIDKILAYPRGKCGPVIGRLSEGQLTALGNLLSLMIGLAD